MPRKTAFVASLLLLFVVAGCGKGGTAKVVADAGEQNPGLKVETATVQIQKMPRYLTLTGSVFADRQSDVAANVSGRVTSTYIERGQPVRANEIIARVDSRAATFQAAAATAQSKAAEASVDQARQDCARADTLFTKGALSKAEYEQQKTQCTSQLYSANAARAQADLAGKLAGDTIIRAPIDGIVGERFVNVGEYVQASTKVASVYAINPVRVSISVPESAVSQVQEGQTLNLRVSAYPDKDFPATIKYVSPALRQTTRDLIIEASAKNEGGALKPGMFATVLLTVGEEDQPTVPVAAIQSDGTVRRMFLEKEGFAYEMVVRTGVEKEGRIAIIEPLKSGEKVVVKPPPGIRDGIALQ